MTASDDRVVAEFRANGGVVVGAGGGVVLLHVGAPGLRRAVPVAAALQGGSWVVSAAAGVEDRDWPDALRERPDAVVETASGSLDVLAIELDDAEERSAVLGAAGAAPVFRLEPQG